MQWHAASDSILACEMADAARVGRGRAFPRLLPFVWLVWLVWLFGPAWFGDQGMEHWLWPTLASLPVFLALYLAAKAMPRRHLIGFGCAVAVVAGLVTPWNPYALTYAIYACAFVAEWGTVKRSAAMIVVLLLAYSAVWVALRYPWPTLTYLWMMSLIISALGWYGRIQAERRAELRLSMDEVRRLAASAERERIGRDLHDLLGHTLSMVALKSELAGRLIERDPATARREIGDVERVAREALAQVRSAVTGIRSAALASELASARLLLETSGVHMQYRGEAGNLPAAIETCLALVLREAVTNIQRHAHAGVVAVDVEQAGGAAHLRIHDDGRGGIGAYGNGLTGMRERVQALHGRFAIDSTPARGTTIDIELPMPCHPPAPPPEDADAAARMRAGRVVPRVDDAA